jgi:hypothetical protein
MLLPRLFKDPCLLTFDETRNLIKLGVNGVGIIFVNTFEVYAFEFGVSDVIRKGDTSDIWVDLKGLAVETKI